jgi:nicotinamide riboside transporter PnuC
MEVKNIYQNDCLKVMRDWPDGCVDAGQMAMFRLWDTKMIEIIGIIATILAITGVILNNRRLRVCFILWLVSNSLTLVIHAQTDVWSLVARDAVFLVLAVEGWIRWGNPSHLRGVEERKKWEKFQE